MSEKRTVRQDAGSGTVSAMTVHGPNDIRAMSAKYPDRDARVALDLPDRLTNDRSTGEYFRMFVSPQLFTEKGFVTIHDSLAELGYPGTTASAAKRAGKP